MELPKFNMKKPNSKIKDQEKLGFFQKRALKKMLKKAGKDFDKVRQNFQKEIIGKDDIINKLLDLTEVLDIQDEVNGKFVQVTREHLEKKSEKALLDDLEEALGEAYKLI